MSSLLDSVQFVKGIGPERVKAFNRLGINTIKDLLYYFPKTYFDRTKIKTIQEALESAANNPESEQTVQGKILTLGLNKIRWRKSIFQIALSDQSGIIYATWFNQPFLKNNFHKGDQLILSGKIKEYKNKPFIESPEYELIKSEDQKPLHAKGIIPCYDLTQGLGQKYLRKTVKTVVDTHAKNLFNTLSLIPEYPSTLLAVPEAIKQIHFPESENMLEQAKETLIWEELFILELALAKKYYSIKRNPVKHAIKIPEQLDLRIKQRIPFTLTSSQEKVISEIKQDLTGRYPMNRLLQGDVGSGKTIIAIYSILAAIGNHTQVAFMAPTEILAEQHFQTISRLLENSKVRISFISSGVKRKERDNALNLIKNGNIDLVIGTHSLIQKDVSFNKLSLLIIDEQHKFGVEQRKTLRDKGENPHMLVMTATPIPQTLTYTIFGDLDLSTINQMPPGRKPITTMLRPTAKLSESLDFIRRKIHEGRQVYFVYPIIDDKKVKDVADTALKSATQMAEYLKKKVFPEYNIQLLHGEMSQRKKDEIMTDFRSGKINILVSTIVIEIGIDVPNACIMVIDNAERYGLAQLHQLRGRIGRGTHNSYCLLFGDFTTPQAESRLKIMEQTTDGFRIAEEDLRIRGPGEFLGTKQSGIPELKIADLSRDIEILKKARRFAFDMIKQDPELKQYPHIKKILG